MINIYNNHLLIKRVSLLLITVSWFIYTGIGFNLKGTPIDISKIIFLIITLIFIVARIKFKINNIDKVFILYIVLQVLSSIFYINFYNQFLYLIYYIVFYYLPYFIARSIFDNNNLFDAFVKYISYTIVIAFIFMIILHTYNIYYFDSYRIAYSKEALEYSHTYMRVFHNIELYKSFVGQYLTPNTPAQFIGMLMVFLIPYYLWKVNKNNIILFFMASIVMIVSLAMTQSKFAVIMIPMQFIILLLLRYQNSIKATMLFILSLCFIGILHYDIILYYFYLLTGLDIYAQHVTSVASGSVSTASSGRIYYYILFFQYILENNLNFLFGYGPLILKFNTSITGITDLAWIFNTFLQVGLCSLFVYMLFYYKILELIWKRYKSNKMQYELLFKYVLAVFIAMLVVSIPTYQAILNPIYFFLIGSIVSLVINETNKKSYMKANDE